MNETQINSLEKDKKRWMLCTEHKKLLEIMYYFYHQITSGPVMVDTIMLLNPNLSKHKSEELVRDLVAAKVLEQVYFVPSNRPTRLRVLFLTKYAVAFILGHLNTAQVTLMKKSSRTEEKMERYVANSRLAYNRLLEQDVTQDTRQIRISYVNSFSSYGLKNNQEYQFLRRIVKHGRDNPAFNDLLNLGDISQDLYDLGQLSIKRLNALKLGHTQKNKIVKIDSKYKDVLKDIDPKNRSDEESFVEEPIGDKASCSLRKVLINTNIAYIYFYEESQMIEVAVDYLINQNSYKYIKTVDNIINVYQYFTYIFRAAYVNFSFNLYFDNKLGYQDFEDKMAKTKKTLDKKVMFPDNITFLLNNI